MRPRWHRSLCLLSCRLVNGYSITIIDPCKLANEIPPEIGCIVLPGELESLRISFAGESEQYVAVNCNSIQKIQGDCPPLFVGLSQGPVGCNVLVEHVDITHVGIVILNALWLVELQNYMLSIDFGVSGHLNTVISTVHS